MTGDGALGFNAQQHKGETCIPGTRKIQKEKVEEYNVHKRLWKAQHPSES